MESTPGSLSQLSSGIMLTTGGYFLSVAPCIRPPMVGGLIVAELWSLPRLFHLALHIFRQQNPRLCLHWRSFCIPGTDHLTPGHHPSSPVWPQGHNGYWHPARNRSLPGSVLEQQDLATLSEPRRLLRLGSGATVSLDHISDPPMV